VFIHGFKVKDSRLVGAREVGSVPRAIARSTQQLILSQHPYAASQLKFSFRLGSGNRAGIVWVFFNYKKAHETRDYEAKGVATRYRADANTCFSTGQSRVPAKVRYPAPGARRFGLVLGTCVSSHWLDTWLPPPYRNGNFNSEAAAQVLAQPTEIPGGSNKAFGTRVRMGCCGSVRVFSSARYLVATPLTETGKSIASRPRKSVGTP
jgi:hypothetical protein